MKQRNYWLMIIVLGINTLTAQVQNNSSIYIGNGAEVNIVSGNYFFGNPPATTSTSRLNSSYGALSFTSDASWSGASNNHFIDGYAKYYGVADFIYPIGQSGILAPVKITAQSNSGINAAYFYSNPITDIGSSLGSTVASLSPYEYWAIKGNTNAKISITWRSSSNIGTLSVGNLNRITIVGWNGSSWNEIPSTVDSIPFNGTNSSISSGSITTNSNVDLTIFTHFSLGIKNVICNEIIASSNITKIWNGSWSPSEPTLADPAIINAPYTGNISCNSLVLNDTITLSNSHIAKIVNSITGNGKIKMASEASLIQFNDNASAPNIELIKETNPMRRYDFLYLSRPINNATTYFATLNDRTKLAVNGDFNQLSPSSVFYDFQTYNTTGATRVTANATNTPLGIGHSAVVRPQAPYSLDQSPGSWYDEKYPISIKMSGIANNGIVNVSIPPNGWIYVGNPYPSAIDAEKLLDAAGNNMRKTIYFWTFNTPRVVWNFNANNYTNSDYATWNYSGGVAACETCQVPTGKIASMQSVLMRGIVPTATTLQLTNCMRVEENNNFFKTSSEENNKFRLNLIASDETFCQTLIAYSSKGTLGFDPGYDGAKISSNTTSLTTLIGTSKYAIQTRPLFDDSDIVPLQVDIASAQNLTISLATAEGIFNSGDATVYLHDKTLNVYHNLNVSPYTFSQSVLSDNTRFDIVYQNSALSNPNLEKANAVVFINNNLFYAQASKIISNIKIFDIGGRLVNSYSTDNSNILTQPFHHAQGVYIVRIELENGEIVNQKLINN